MTVTAGACALLAFSDAPVVLKTGLFLLILILYSQALKRAKNKPLQSDWTLQPDMLPDAIIISDLNGKLLFANGLATQLFPNFSEAATISNLFDVWHGSLNNRKPADDVVAAALAAPDFQFTETLHFHDGSVFERLTRVGTGENQRLWILHDISHLQQASHDSEMHTSLLEADAARTAELAEQLYHAKGELEANQVELTRLANTDSLTGLYNRRRFTALGQKAIKTTQSKKICIIMMDIDHFKRINDTYGHAAGDVAIRDFSAIVEKEVGKLGFVGRMGGEEFAVVLENMEMNGAISIAETIRKATAAHTTRHESEKFRYTISLGVAPWLEGEISIEAALDRSDQALYSAKSFGRNRVVGYETASAL